MYLMCRHSLYMKIQSITRISQPLGGIKLDFAFNFRDLVRENSGRLDESLEQ